MEKRSMQSELRKLPSVDSVLNQPVIRKQIERNGADFVTFVVRSVVENVRYSVLNGGICPEAAEIIAKCDEAADFIRKPILKEVLNATGVIIHTNLGRAPLGKKVLEDIKGVISGYSNLEYDLKTGERGHRNDHIVPLLKYITKAEDAVIVNNNAAGIMLALGTFAKGKEVIISRGELIEIGGSFRIPEILAASGAIMVEVGTTNKTRLSDYEKAITQNTAMIFKAHRSNFDIVGFTEEASVHEIAEFSHKKGIPFLYDIGSGLIRKPKNLNLESEPDVESAILDGADLVAFSGDKLLGGSQAGVVAGRKEFISKLKTAPMMRALRVDKLTLATLSSVIRSYFNDKTMIENIPLFSIIEQTPEQLKKKAEELVRKFNSFNVSAKVVRTEGKCGGGTLPGVKIESYGAVIVSNKGNQKERSDFAEKIFRSLHELERPVVGILKQGEIIFDVLTLDHKDFEYIAENVSQIVGEQR